MSEYLFDFYEILVESVFGSVGLAILGVALLMLILMIAIGQRMSFLFAGTWLMFYFIVMGAAYLGAIGTVFGFMFCLIYFSIAVIRFFFTE